MVKLRDLVSKETSFFASLSYALLKYRYTPSKEVKKFKSGIDDFSYLNVFAFNRI